MAIRAADGQKDSSGPVSLNIIKNEPFINRLYEIANKLFFGIISKLVMLPIFPSEPVFTTPLLRMLATLSFNLSNCPLTQKTTSRNTAFSLKLLTSADI
jgi:hypothetical protein